MDVQDFGLEILEIQLHRRFKTEATNSQVYQVESTVRGLPKPPLPP